MPNRTQDKETQGNITLSVFTVFVSILFYATVGTAFELYFTHQDLQTIGIFVLLIIATFCFTSSLIVIPLWLLNRYKKIELKLEERGLITLELIISTIAAAYLQKPITDAILDKNILLTLAFAALLLGIIVIPFLIYRKVLHL